MTRTHIGSVHILTFGNQSITIHMYYPYIDINKSVLAKPIIHVECNRTSLRQTIVFGIDRCSIYTGLINKDFLHRNFIYVRFVQDSGLFSVRVRQISLYLSIFTLYLSSPHVNIYVYSLLHISFSYFARILHILHM